MINRFLSPRCGIGERLTERGGVLVSDRGTARGVRITVPTCIMFLTSKSLVDVARLIRSPCHFFHRAAGSLGRIRRASMSRSVVKERASFLRWTLS